MLLGGVVFHQGNVVFWVVADRRAQNTVQLAPGGEQADDVLGHQLHHISLDAVAQADRQHRDQDLPVQTSDSLAQKLFSIEDNAVLDSIILSNPMLSMLEAEANSYKAKAEMDKKMSLPMFGIGLQYSIMAKNSEEMARMSGMSNMNGMDMVMPMIKTSIPIFRRNITPSSGRAGITVRQAS